VTFSVFDFGKFRNDHLGIPGAQYTTRTNRKSQTTKKQITNKSQYPKNQTHNLGPPSDRHSGHHPTVIPRLPEMSVGSNPKTYRLT
jgi:hypothetical protein